MPSNSTYYQLALYDPITDQSEKFLDWRNAVSGVATTSNMNKIDEALHTHDVLLTNLQDSKGFVRVSAYYVGPNNFAAEDVNDIDSYFSKLGIIVSLDQTNTGTVMLDINGLGAKALMKYNISGGLVNLDPGDLRINHRYHFQYTGTVWAWVDQTIIDNTGWVSAFLEGETWTYASATSFTVTGDVTTKYEKGAKLRLIQSGTIKYFYVVSSSYSSPVTTVVITGGSDYVLANVAISANHYSRIENPVGFPHWFNWTPTFAGFSTNPVGTYRFKINGRMVTFNIDQTTNGTSNGATFGVTSPTACASQTGGACALLVDNDVVLASSGRWFLATSGSNIVINKDMATTPWTTSGGKRARLQGFYEL